MKRSRRLLRVVLVLVAALAALFGWSMTAAPASSGYETVHAHRWGPIRFGETIQQARSRGANVRFDRRQHTWTEHGCGVAAVRSGGRTVGWVMVWDVKGREVIQRASFAQGDPTPASTASGVSLGMTERRLRKRAERLGWDLVVEQHPYGARGDHKITHRVRRDGVRYAYVYDTFRHDDGRKRVVVIYAGRRNAARAVDGCFSAR